MAHSLHTRAAKVTLVHTNKKYMLSFASLNICLLTLIIPHKLFTCLKLFISASKSFVGDEDTKRGLLLIAESHIRASQMAKIQMKRTPGHPIIDRRINSGPGVHHLPKSSPESPETSMMDSVLGGRFSVKPKIKTAVTEFLALEEALKRLNPTIWICLINTCSVVIHTLAGWDVRQCVDLPQQHFKIQ